MPPGEEAAAELESIARNFSALARRSGEVDRAGDLLVAALRGGGKVMFCGNGGSAADAQHLAAELTGRYRKDRAPIAGLALTVDSSALTAIGNDYGFDEVFARQVAALGRPGDALVAISTSGNSRNVLRAAETARALGVVVLGLTGDTGGRLAALCDLCLAVPARQANRIQEMHIAIGHILCGRIEDALG